MNLLKPVNPPRNHRHNLGAQQSPWYSWSPETIQQVNSTAHLLRKLPPPCCISVRGCDPYPSSYSYRLSKLPKQVASLALTASEALLRHRVDKKLRFVTDMLSPPFTSSLLHKFFALIRAGIVHLNGDARTALHAPVRTKRADDGFALHCDLFLTDRLFLIFDKVFSGNSGKSVFLSRDAFDTVIARTNLMPGAARREIRTLMSSKVTADSFDEWFDLVYSDENAWRTELAHEMKRQSWAIKLQRGEGYILHDRHWLHGRTPAVEGISDKRFRRLVYGRGI